MRNLKRSFSSVFVALVMAWMVGGATADETNETKEESSVAGDEAPAASAEQIDQWIRELDSDKYSERENATQKLIEAGAPAVGSAAQAAQGESREAASRAVRVLKQIMLSGGSEARAAIEKLAKHNDERVARRASKALEDAEEKSAQAQVRRPILRLPVAGRVQFQRAFQAVRVGNVNGVKTVDATENDTKIHIEDNPAKGILIKVTAKVAGKDKVTEYTAKNKDELKKKHPEGFKLYEKYLAGGAANARGMLQLRVNGQQFPAPGLVPAAPGQRLQVPQPAAPAKVAAKPNPAAAPKADAQPKLGAAEQENRSDSKLKEKSEEEKDAGADQASKLKRLTEQLKDARERIEQLEREIKELKAASSGE